jgi:hypothetical protein
LVEQTAKRQPLPTLYPRFANLSIALRDKKSLTRATGVAYNKHKDCRFATAAYSTVYLVETETTNLKDLAVSVFSSGFQAS